MAKFHEDRYRNEKSCDKTAGYGAGEKIAQKSLDIEFMLNINKSGSVVNPGVGILLFKEFLIVQEIWALGDVDS